jgi:hypothetical protein
MGMRESVTTGHRACGRIPRADGRTVAPSVGTSEVRRGSMDGALPTHLTQFESGKSRAQTGRTVETSGNFQVFCLATNNFK